MAHVIERINELRALDSDQHLFCPRVGASDGTPYFDEEIASYGVAEDPIQMAERKRLVQESQERKWLAMDALQVLAFDGEEAEPFQAWMTARLEHDMTRCDICVRVFHQSRAEWRNKLVEQYDEENIVEFLRIIDDLCIKRIASGLDVAKTVLKAAEPKKRGPRILPGEALYALSESMSCDAFLRNEELLQRYFDEPFQLVQTKKPLRLPTVLPAATRHLFSSNQVRREWAMINWSSLSRNVFPAEFEWAVRDHLVDAMSRVQMSNLDLGFTGPFWFGVKLIVNKLDKSLVTDSIRGLEGNFYKLILEHLSLMSDGFLDLIATIALLLEKSPTDFWDAIDTITPSTTTVVEQVLNAPVLKFKLVEAGNGSQERFDPFGHLFIWITPFLSSLKVANLEPACKAFSNLLFGHLQSEGYPPAARARCFKEGLRVLNYSFKKMNQGKGVSNFVGQPTVNGMLQILSTHIKLVMARMKTFGGPETQTDLRLVHSMIKEAFILETQSLHSERALISAKQPSPRETPPSRPIWKAVVQAIDSERLDLAINLLIAGRNLIGLEQLLLKKGVNEQHVSPTIRHFNDRFNLLSQSITDVIDRLVEFDPTKLLTLFDDLNSAGAIVSTLFSSTEETRNSSVELLKVISAKDERQEAIQHVLGSYYRNFLQGVSDSCRHIIDKKALTPSPSMIKTCSNIIEVMCDSQDGILRSRKLNPDERKVTMSLWKTLWETLTMIFQTTEGWSNLGYYDKNTMMEFCRDTMEFADLLFEQCSVFASALKPGNTPDEHGASNELLKELLGSPAQTMAGISRWLRLRDPFLSRKSVTLISNLLSRLKRVGIEIDPDTLTFMEKVIKGEVKAKLSLQQTAELLRALEFHLGRPVQIIEEPAKQPRQDPISKWMAASPTQDSKSRDAGARAKLMAETTRTAPTNFKSQHDARKAHDAQVLQAQAAKQEEFRRKRAQDKEKTRQQKAAEAARARKNLGMVDDTTGAGSGLEGLGVLGKDQAPKGEGLMHSSDESSEEGDLDEELFGTKTEKKVKSGPKTNIINGLAIRVPYKKPKVYRKEKHMQARLAPDLSPLHKQILGWNYFHEGDLPPNSRPDEFSQVLDTFPTPNAYQETFAPLLRLEAWQAFVNFKDENPDLKSYEIRIVSRASVDAFQELGSTMTHVENKETSISEGDVVLLSQSRNPTKEDRSCLARVFRVNRSKGHVQVSYRIMPSNPLQSSLVPNGIVYGAKIDSITSTEREYAALAGLQYYDLCDEIIRAKPSPLLEYRNSQLDSLISNYDVNKAQAKAVKSAIDNDGFTLIQGPPGSGKTKTIVAIVGAILSDTLRYAPTQGAKSESVRGKLLVCAPSNAAVDELVMRFKKGVKTLSGQDRKLNIVRLGRPDKINSNVHDVTLENLINKRLNLNTSSHKDTEDTKKVFEDHKRTCEQIRQVNSEIAAARLVQNEIAAGIVKEADVSRLQDVSKLENALNALYTQKRSLGTKIDDIKDTEKREGRNQDLARRKAQADILGSAHVICGTLSGAGHEMFQTLSVDFETVIVDEAACAVEMSALIPLKYGCSKCILVGDPKQLPPTVFSKQAAYLRLGQSLFVRMQKNHPDDVHLLDTQYRMHPEISQFPRQAFYDGKLLDGGDMASLRKQPWHASSLLGPYRFFDVAGQHASQGKSLVNRAEIEVAMQLYHRLTSDFDKLDWRGKIGIITPYKMQLNELKKKFEQKYTDKIFENVEFNTTDAYQGRESEVIIFSCVRASPAGGIGFLNDVRRMNVGLTRAKSSLFVLGNAYSLRKGDFWRNMIDDAQQRDRYTTGNVRGMLTKHSSSFPATNFLKELPAASPYKELPHQPKFKKEPEPESAFPDLKAQQFFKPEMIKSEDAKVKVDQMDTSIPTFNGKRKLSIDEDIEMVDLTSDSPNTNSRQSTPAIVSGAASKSATPAPDAIKPAMGAEAEVPRPTDVLGAMTNPKIRRRPRNRDPVNPLLQRPPKKPKLG